MIAPFATSNPLEHPIFVWNDVFMNVVLVGMYCYFYYQLKNGTLKTEGKHFSGTTFTGNIYRYVSRLLIVLTYLFYFTFILFLVSREIELYEQTINPQKGFNLSDINAELPALILRGVLTNILALFILINNLATYHSYQSGGTQPVNETGHTYGFTFKQVKHLLGLTIIFVLIQTGIFTLIATTGTYALAKISIVIFCTIPLLLWSALVIWYYFWGARKIGTQSFESKYPPIIIFTEAKFYTFFVILMACWFGIAFLTVYYGFLS